MITGDNGKRFLTNYNLTTKDFFADYMREEEARAHTIGVHAGKVMQSYANTAQLGKKIRGALCVLGYMLAGKDASEDILRTSLAFEHLHAGFLLHDDIMDDDDWRRGIPSVHRQFIHIGEDMGLNNRADLFGRSMAILGGSAGYFLAMDILSQITFASPELHRKALKLFTDYSLRTNYGQILDVWNAYEQHIDEETILQVLRYKSAEYTGVMPLLIGATLGGLTDDKRLQALHDYGLAFGWAFQIQDDVLGVFGKHEETGKPVGKDILEGKQTLLILETWRNADEIERKDIQTVFGNKHASQADVARISDLIRLRGGLEYTLKKGWDYVEKGKACIAAITHDSEQEELLASLITYMMERTL